MSDEFSGNKVGSDRGHVYVIDGFRPEALTTTFILIHSSDSGSTESKGTKEFLPFDIEINAASFTYATPVNGAPLVTVRLFNNNLLLSCTCYNANKRLCEHEAQALFTIKNRKEIRIFFDENLRQEKLMEEAKAYGLDKESLLERYFQLNYLPNRSTEIIPKQKELFPVNHHSSNHKKELLLAATIVPPPHHQHIPDKDSLIVVIGHHRFYNGLSIELFSAQSTREGKVKNPLTSVFPLELVWKTADPSEIKFYTALSKFQYGYSSEKSSSDLEALKALLANPLGLRFYQHNAAVSVNINAASIEPVQLKSFNPELRLFVHQEEEFYRIKGQLLFADKAYELNTLRLRYQYFVQLEETLQLVDNLAYLQVIDFFKQYNNNLLIHTSKFEEFRQSVLEKLEHRIHIHHSYVKPASPEQLAILGFKDDVEHLIYLSDSEDFVLITPVIRYGYVEMPVLSKKQLYMLDHAGNPFLVERDAAAELEFIAILLQQHPFFEEQLHLENFYLHKDRFLEENWFLEAFEVWRSRNITILGFNSLKNNRLNGYRAKVQVGVSSGVDWFDTKIKVSFGNQQVSLKHLHKSLRNKSRFVNLDDGTLGIIPAEWIDRFAKYFQEGTIVGDRLRIPKTNFASIQELFEEEVLTEEVKGQLALYQEKLFHFNAIEAVQVPQGLHASLREYQQQGLNWLNFLDTFGFGGCLADDMGLGKTLQVLAFLLSQRTRQPQNTNLVVVPATLIFNWQAEIEKFCPSLRVLTFWGARRNRQLLVFDEYELILTTYGTLLSDIRLLKQYKFNYVVLDESQNIKNPESQRYKAARLLQSRNKLILTGTPFENSTFDIYGQLSFACPGLFGSKQNFKEQYAAPIDKFKDSKHALALQKKISPFILRRTKDQVAKELPEKTEMTIFCEMGSEQRNIYNSFAKEYREFLLAKDEGDISKHSLHILQGLTRLRQICNSPALLNNQQYYGSTSAKINVLIEQLENKGRQHKILVFSQFVAMLDLIRTELKSRKIPFAYLTGKTRNRAEQVQRFQQNDEVRVFLISLKAGGTGLNLTRADYVYLVDPWWNPAVENQAIDRAYRIGQQKNVVAVRLLCPDTIEDKILKLQAAKSQMAGDLIKTDAAMAKSFSKEELIELFGNTTSGTSDEEAFERRN